jgi:hypothetical protein
MNRLTGHLLLIVAALLSTPTPSYPDGPGTAASACSLPATLKKTIQASYPQLVVVSDKDLTADHRSLFRAEHKSACPGLATGKYWGKSERKGFAVLLGDSKQYGEVRLVVARPMSEGWILTELEAPQDGPAPVVWTQPPGVYEDPYNELKRRTKNDVIMFVGYESWARAYIWNGRKFETLQITD